MRKLDEVDLTPNLIQRCLRDPVFVEVLVIQPCAKGLLMDWPFVPQHREPVNIAPFSLKLDGTAPNPLG